MSIILAISLIDSKFKEFSPINKLRKLKNFVYLFYLFLTAIVIIHYDVFKCNCNKFILFLYFINLFRQLKLLTPYHFWKLKESFYPLNKDFWYFIELFLLNFLNIILYIIFKIHNHCQLILATFFINFKRNHYLKLFLLLLVHLIIVTRVIIRQL